MSRFSGAVRAEESFRAWEQERKTKRFKYWEMLRRAKTDYLKATEQFEIDHDFDPGAFYYYLQRNYGVKVEIIDGKISENHHVIDNAKFMMFILKYSS